MKTLFTAALALIGLGDAVAGGYTPTAIPTRIEVVRSEGFMVFGPFGNVGGCASTDSFFVKSSHPQYKNLYAAALAALSARAKLSGYIQSCEAVTWYSVNPIAFNIVDPASTLAIEP